MLHPRDEIDRLYVSRQKRGGGLANIEYSKNESIQGLDYYIKISKERLITAASNSTDNIRINRALKNWKKKCEEKLL